MALKETNLEKLKALQLTLDKIENIPVIPSGSIALDKALVLVDIPKAGSSKFTDRNLPVKRH